MSVRRSGGRMSPVGVRGRLALALVGTVALTSGLVACGDDRPPKPGCRSGYVADWDDDDNEWECERRGSSSGTGGSSRRRR